MYTLVRSGIKRRAIVTQMLETALFQRKYRNRHNRKKKACGEGCWRFRFSFEDAFGRDASGGWFLPSGWYIKDRLPRLKNGEAPNCILKCLMLITACV
jgi:hypothetical protein